MAGKWTQAEIKLPDPPAANDHVHAVVRGTAVDEVGRVQFAIEELGM